MSNRKLVRRVLFAAAVSMSTSAGTNAIAFQEYQPGKPGNEVPQGSTSVTQELHRMFQESGQPMPSMIAQDLPNANVPLQGQVRPRLQQNQNGSQPQSQAANQPQVRAAATSSKPSFLGRIFGKLRGDTAGNNPNYRPPVPPDYKPAAAMTASNGSVQHQSQPTPQKPVQANGQPSQVAQNPNAQQGQKQLSQNSTQPLAGQPNYGNKQTTLKTAGSNPVRNGDTSEIPPRSGGTVQTVNTFGNAATTGERTGFTQPGSAPAFMSSVGSGAVVQKQSAAVPSSENIFRDDFLEQNSPASHGGDGSQIKAQIEVRSVTAAKDTADKFKNPFLDAADSNAESDSLDLDSLIDIPAGTPVSEPTASLDSRQPSQLANEAGFSQANIEDVQKESLLGPDENPFTGVQLNTSDAEFFVDDEPVADSSIAGIPLTPMEDFNADLPAMKLPAIDLPAVDLPGVDDKNSAAAPELNRTVDSARKPAVDLTLPAGADIAARAELNAIPDVPAAMSEAETEQLRQIAEQERHQRQRRLIQSRAGKSGFKGFCPVQLREHRELVETSDQFTSTFGLQTYFFSSAEAKASFDVEPSRYAAAAGGSDVVLLVNSGEEQPGLLDYALWYRDRLYMFRSRETMTLFSKDPQRFASQY